MSIPEQPINWQQVGEETLHHLQTLLHLDTRNPPGNETLAATYLCEVLTRANIESVIVGPAPQRGTLIARLRGEGLMPPLLLMSHTDVVPVEFEYWTQNPFGGEIVNGFVYGRGALDMKFMTAMELMTMLLLKERHVPLKRDVILMAEADEEAGGQLGAAWVVAHHPELIQAEYALNEGGGMYAQINGQRYCLIAIGEKSHLGIRLRTQGTSGHSAMPRRDNAVFKLASVLSRLRERQFPIHILPSLYATLAAVTGSAQAPSRVQATLTDPALKGRRLPDLANLLLRNSATPTQFHAGTSLTSIPSQAEAFLDVRLLPGWTPQMFVEELRTLIGDQDEVEIEPLKEAVESYETPFPSPLTATIQEVLQHHCPGTTLLPWLIPGSSDARHLAKLGIKVYGFAPMPSENSDAAQGVHGHDERISVRTLYQGVQMLYEIVERFVRQENLLC